MSAPASQDNIVNGMGAIQQIVFCKPQLTAVAAYRTLRPASTFVFPGYPGAGSTPATGAGTTYNSSSAGAPSYTAATGGQSTYLIGSQAFSSKDSGSWFLYDRLWSNSGLSGTTTTIQSFTQTAIPTRWTGFKDIELWIDDYTICGGTATTATIVNYTNQDGTATSTTFPMFANTLGGTTNIAGSCFPIPLASGDTGVVSVQSITLGVSTGTAGNFGFTIRRRLAEGVFPGNGLQGGGAFIGDYADHDCVPVGETSCLELMTMQSGLATGTDSVVILDLEQM